MALPPPSAPQPAAEPPKPAGTPGWIKALLVVSLALNLAVAGLVAGVFLRMGGGSPHGLAVRDLGFGPFSEALDDADRAALRLHFAERAPDLRDLRQSLRRDGAEVLAALRAEPFDAARLTEVLKRQGERIAERLDLGQELLAERIAAMSPEARLAFADRLERSLTRRGGDRGGDHGGDRGGERGGEPGGNRDGN
jgi:uncharacterized membrane protein